jgi:hypothetical protein
VKKKDFYVLVLSSLVALAIMVYDIVRTVLIYVHRPVDYNKATSLMESFVIGIPMLATLLVFVVIYKNRRK